MEPRWNLSDERSGKDVMLDAQDTMLRRAPRVVPASVAPEVGVAAATMMGVPPVPIPEVAKMTETGYICELWMRQ